MKLFILVALIGCARKEEPTVAADPVADHVWILASHKERKPSDPVHVAIDKFTVTKASFDPKNLEGGTASLALDLTSLHSGSSQRDDHLKSDSYLDIGKFATATIDIANVKRVDDKHFTADADVKLRALEKHYAVTFEVLATTADSVRIKGAQQLARADFGIGKDASDDDESVGPDLTIELQLTLKKT